LDKYWIWLEESKLINKHEKNQMLILHKSPKKIYESLCGKIEIREILELEAAKADKIIKACSQESIQIITQNHNAYKPCAHFVVYIKGETFAGRLSAILGTRACTARGLINTKAICRRWIEKKGRLSGGLSDGIEKQVRDSAHEMGGEMVLFIGRGIRKSDICKSNETLISPFPPGKETSTYGYHKRNDLLIAWSDIFILIEGSLQSGAYKLSQKALKAGKLVYALQTQSKSHSFDGNRALLKVGGQPYKCIWNGYLKKLSSIQKEIMIFIKDNPQSTDSVLNHLGQPAKGIHELLDLQMKGFVIYSGDGFWR
jgi:predicted Rossmann fold nucleotide-binding protein DprA/Smf involved in DNA uptake